MRTTTVNISFQEDLLSDIDRVAKSESRSRSELLREAARLYIERKKKWNSIFSFAKKIRKNSGRKITEKDIATEIQEYRRQKNK